MDTLADYQQDASAMGRIDAWKWAWSMGLQHPVLGGGFGVFVLDAGSIRGKSGWLRATIFFSKYWQSKDLSASVCFVV